MRTMRFLGCVAAFGAAAAFAHGYSFLNELYNTGMLDDSSISVSPQTVKLADAHYSLYSYYPPLYTDFAPYKTAYVTSGYGGAWTTAGAASQWITPAVDANGTAKDVGNTLPIQFDYTLSFKLATTQSVDIVGQWMADNGSDGGGLVSQILVNGVATNQSIPYDPSTNGQSAFKNWHIFTLNNGNSGFVVGENTVTFSVTNWGGYIGGNPTGLRAEFQSANAVPEPFTLILGAAAFAIGIGRRRTRKN